MRIIVALVLCAGVTTGCANSPLELVTGDRPVAVRAEDDAVLQVGADVEADLTGSIPRRSHPLSLGEGQRAIVTLEGIEGALDPYLRIYDQNGDLVTEDDDGGDGLDSRATLRVTQPTTFTIEAGSYRDASTGRYRLAIQPQTGTPPAPSQVLLVEQGEVVPTSSERSRFAFQGSAGEEVVITVDVLTGALDPVVELLGPDGMAVGRDDDGGEGRNSRLQVRLRASGTHVIAVTAFAADQSGEFEVVVATSRRPGSLTGARPPQTARPLAPVTAPSQGP